MRTGILLSLTLFVACSNITRTDLPDGNDRPPEPNGIDPGWGDCPDFDWTDCPTQPSPDAGLTSSEADAAVPPPSGDDMTTACCHALLDGQPPKHECGYPPGLCLNGKKTMFCKDSLGNDARFELCNP